MNYMRPKGGHLYVVAMSNGLTKVGRSSDPSKRVNEHRVEAARYGVTLTNSWTSDYFPDMATAENELIEYAAEQGNPGAGNEYFTDLDFAQSVEFARAINAAELIETDDDPERSLVSRNLRGLVARSGKTVAAIAGDMGIGRESLHSKMNGSRHLNMPELIGLAQSLALKPSVLMAELTRAEDAA